MRVEFHPEAVAELEDSADWYGERSRSAARNFAVDLAVEKICQDPDRFSWIDGVHQSCSVMKFPEISQGSPAMSTAEDELRDFTAFVQGRIARGEAEKLGLAELFDLWMLENLTELERATNVAAINASINDYMKGERGTPAGEHSQELRQRYGLNHE